MDKELAADQRVDVTVLLNENPWSMFAQYHDGDRLIEALAFHTRLADLLGCGGTVGDLLGVVWDELNKDAPSTGWAVAYRSECNRSLSVGDVVAVDAQAFAVENIGWRAVTVDGSQITWNW